MWGEGGEQGGGGLARWGGVQPVQGGNGQGGGGDTEISKKLFVVGIDLKDLDLVIFIR